MRWKILVVLLLTAGSLMWAVWGMDARATADALASFDARWLVPAIALNLGTLAIRTVRFQRLLDRPVGFRDMLSVMAVGFLAIMVVPLRMGELVRPYLLSERQGVPFGSGMAAVVLERLLDMCALLAFIAATAWFVDLPDGGLVVATQGMEIDLLQAGRAVLGTSVIVGLVGVVGLAVVGPPGVAWLERVALRVAPFAAKPIASLGGRFVGAFRSLAARPLDAAVALTSTVAIWIASTAALACVMLGFDAIGTDLGMVLLNWTASITGMTLVPTPGFVGGFEAGSIASLELLGVEHNVAVAFAATQHTVMFAFTAAMGALFLALEGLSLVQLVRASQQG